MPFPQPQAPHVPTEKTRHTVFQASGMGITQENIATLIGISVDTLAKYYDHELKNGKADAHLAIAKTLYHKAVHDKDTASLIWWTKSQLRWSETVKNEVIASVATVSADKLSDDQLASIIASTPKRAGGGSSD